MSDVPLQARTFFPIWDIPLRLFHWTLLAAVAVAGVTGFVLPVNWLNLHLIAGTAIATLLLLRLVWGFTGSAYSRFASFIFAPSTILSYARQNLRGSQKHYNGHNPLASAMIFALFLTLAVIVTTGVITLGGAEKQGPLRAVLTYATGTAAKQLHELAAYGLLLLIAGHLAGVLIESRRTNENLPLAMVTGLKAADADGNVKSRWLRRLKTDETPLRITEMPWWIRAHNEEVSPSAFTNPKVRSKANCIACHRAADKGLYEDD